MPAPGSASSCCAFKHVSKDRKAATSEAATCTYRVLGLVLAGRRDVLGPVHHVVAGSA